MAQFVEIMERGNAPADLVEKMETLRAIDPGGEREAPPASYQRVI